MMPDELAIAHVRAVEIQPGDRVLDRPAGWPTVAAIVDRTEPDTTTVIFNAADDTDEQAGICTYVDYWNDTVVAVVCGPNHPGPNACATVDQAVDRIRHTIADLNREDDCTACAGSGKRHSIFDFCGCEPECEGLGACGWCGGSGIDPGHAGRDNQFVNGQISGLYVALAGITDRPVADLRAEPLPADPTQDRLAADLRRAQGAVQENAIDRSERRVG